MRRARHAALVPPAYASYWLFELNRDKEKHPQQFKVSDFLPDEEEDDDDPTADGERMLDKTRAMIARFGGEDLTAGMNIQIIIPEGAE